MPDIPEINQNMDQNPWSLSYLQPSTPNEESLNNYGADNPDSLLMSCQGLPPISTVEPPATPSLQNSNYEALISPTLQPSKEEDFFADTLFNGVCKENQTGIHNFVQTQNSSQNEGTSFPISESNAAYTGPVPSISFNSSTSERRSPGPFGVLPHEAVMTRSAPRYQDRNNDKFISPVSKTASASYNNGPYTDRDVSSIYSSAPLSAQSAFSGDTASLSPVVNSVTSPSIVSNFSSPSEYYSSPKTNFGAYNSLQSPVPQSPSVAQHSYPSSPFANVDPVGHISSAPPCSPMSAGTYVNNLNAVPQRNGQMSQPSPSNSAANGNIMCFNTPQTPSMVNHGPQPVLPKTSDYHSEYGFPHDPNSQSTYSPVYPAIHSAPMSGANGSRMSHRTPMQHQNMQQEGRMPYPHSSSQSSASTNYLQNNICHDGYGASSSVPTGQSMHPPRYPCATPMNNNLSHGMVHTNPPGMMSNQMGSDRSYSYPSNNSMDDKKPVNLYNPHIDSSVHHNHNANHLSYMNHEVSHLDSNMHPCRQLNRQIDHPNDPHKLNCMNLDNSNRGMMSHVSMGREHGKEDMHPTYNMNFSYGSSVPRRSRSRNLSPHTPRRRGRRGRRRKSEIGSMTRYQSFKTDRIYSNYPMTPNFLDYGNVETQSTYPKRMCDEKELPPMNYPLSRYRSELKMNDTEKKSSVVIPKPRKILMTVEEEVGFLEHLTFPEEEEKESPHSFMKTRNKDCEGFLQCYRNFLVNRKSSSESDSETAPGHGIKSKSEHHAPKEHREKRCYKPIPKLIFGRSNNPGEWRLKQPYASPETISDSESASESSGELISSHKIKQEYDSEEEKSKLLKLTGNFNKISHRVSKHSAKRKNDSNDHSDKYYDHKDKRFTNYETLSAGRLQIKTEIEELPPNVPKKRGRKKKIPAVKAETKKKSPKSAANSSEAVNETPVRIKQEIIEDEDVVVECQRRSTRSLSKRSDASIQDAEAGPSIKKEPVDISSDDIDIIDDSDSDPAWTPTAKTLKVGDHIKAHPIPTPVKKRGPKPGRRSSAGNGLASKVKKEKSRESVPTSTRKRKPNSKSVSCKQETVCEPEKVKKERVCGRFLVAKADIEKPTPYLWLVDTETNMLQRFEWYEQQGIVLYRSTYTYAAWNEISFANYVKAKVKVVSHSRILHVVEYLGPELQEEVENNSVGSKLPAKPLRENFEVFLQTLISQALDPNFLSEITNENDEYFLNNIKEIESVSEEKKKKLVKDFWKETLQKCADTYPCVNILDSLSDDETCEVCKKEGASKLLQFYGQPYDWTTLGSVDMILASKTQYTVCLVCSATVSLYSRLHHQKYNFFIKCRTKMNEVKNEGSKMESHILLETCLQDHTWVNALFAELEQMWHDCDENS